LMSSSSNSSSSTLEEKYDLVELRRSKLLKLLASGLSQSEAADSLGVDKSTISKDVKAMKKEAREGIREYIEETLPFEHKKTITAYDEILRQAWYIAAHYAEDPRLMLQALNVISDALIKRQQILGDPQYIERAIKTVTELRKKFPPSPQRVKEPVKAIKATESKPKPAEPEKAALEPEQDNKKNEDDQADPDPVIGIEIVSEDLHEI
jgi:hypothetical protein